MANNIVTHTGNDGTPAEHTQTLTRREFCTKAATLPIAALPGPGTAPTQAELDALRRESAGLRIARKHALLTVQQFNARIEQNNEALWAAGHLEPDRAIELDIILKATVNASLEATHHAEMDGAK